MPSPLTGRRLQRSEARTVAAKTNLIAVFSLRNFGTTLVRRHLSSAERSAMARRGGVVLSTRLWAHGTA
jgi:hypothetical protein